MERSAVAALDITQQQVGITTVPLPLRPGRDRSVGHRVRLPSCPAPTRWGIP